MKKIISIFGLFFIALQSQTVTWDVPIGGDDYWTTDINWSSGSAPNSSSVAVLFNKQPTASIELDSGGETSVGSITFDNALTASMSLVPFGPSTLKVVGAITNFDDNRHTFGLGLTAGANAIWTGPLSFTNKVDFQNFDISVSGNLNFSGTRIYFNINNASNYGSIDLLSGGSITLGGSTKIDISATLASSLVAGNSFDFINGAFAAGSLGDLPTLSSGLYWDSSKFYTDGILTVSAIPEPSTYAMLVLSGLIFFVVRRKSRLAMNPITK